MKRSSSFTGVNVTCNPVEMDKASACEDQLEMLPAPSTPTGRSDHTSVQPARFRHMSFTSSSASKSSPIIPAASGSAQPSHRIVRRLSEIKRDADLRHTVATDYQGEKFTNITSQISTSWDGLNLVPRREEVPEPLVVASKEEVILGRKRTQSLTESLTIFTSFHPSPVCSPSPSRSNNDKQCFSPSMQQIVRGTILSPSPSPTPSPTRSRSYFRSLSPIARPGNLMLKRKYDSDSESIGGEMTPKRYHHGAASCSSSRTNTPDRVLVPPSTSLLFGAGTVLPPPQPLQHSLSASSLDSDVSESVSTTSGCGSTCDIVGALVAASSTAAAPPPTLSSRVFLTANRRATLFCWTPPPTHSSSSHSLAPSSPASSSGAIVDEMTFEDELDTSTNGATAVEMRDEDELVQTDGQRSAS